MTKCDAHGLEISAEDDASLAAIDAFSNELLAMGTNADRILEAAAAMSRDHLVLETVTALRHEPVPAMRLFTELELDRDPTNFWAPNILALREMCRRFGYTRFGPPAWSARKFSIVRHRCTLMPGPPTRCVCPG